MDNEQFRALLTKHLSDCRKKAKEQGRELYSFVQALPDTSVLEQEALQDESTRRLLIAVTVKKDQYIESGRGRSTLRVPVTRTGVLRI
jgi:hypothetical protein